MPMSIKLWTETLEEIETLKAQNEQLRQQNNQLLLDIEHTKRFWYEHLQQQKELDNSRIEQLQNDVINAEMNLQIMTNLFEEAKEMLRKTNEALWDADSDASYDDLYESNKHYLTIIGVVSDCKLGAGECNNCNDISGNYPYCEIGDVE